MARPYDAIPVNLTGEPAHVFWEAWPSERTRNGRLLWPVAADQRTVLFAALRRDAELAAAAPDLYRAVVSLLRLVEMQADGVFFRTDAGIPAPIPREFRDVVPLAVRAIAKAEGKEHG